VNHAVKYGGKHRNNEEEIRDEILQVDAVRRLRRIRRKSWRRSKLPEDFLLIWRIL
jgi:hypothetical protein